MRYRCFRRVAAAPALFFCLGWGAWGAGGAAAQTTGAIRGTVTLQAPGARRAASRYPGAPTAVRTVQRISPVVYLEGRVEAVPLRTGGTTTMAQQDTAFVPSALVVEVGTTVRFPNEDAFYHNVFSYSAAARFDLGRYPRGEAKEVTLERAGVVKVYCEVHEFMRAVIVVTENPFHAVVDEAGRFRIDGVPPGEYTAVVWHPDVDEVRRRIVVSAGTTTVLDAELR